MLSAMESVQVISLAWCAVIKIAALAGVFSCGLVALGSWLFVRFTKMVDSYTENFRQNSGPSSKPRKAGGRDKTPDGCG